MEEDDDCGEKRKDVGNKHEKEPPSKKMKIATSSDTQSKGMQLPVENAVLLFQMFDFVHKASQAYKGLGVKSI